VRIGWTTKAEGATRQEALASVRTEQQAWIVERVARVRTQLSYDISRAELSQLILEVADDYKVVNVFDANVRQWSVDQGDSGQKITVQLFEPAKQSQRITVELEKFTGDDPQQDLKIPAIKAQGVGRQQGVVVVQVASGLRAEAIQHSGLLQVDAAELSSTLSKGKWSFSYRYTRLPFELTLRIEKVQPRIEVDSLVQAYVEPQQLTLEVLAIYNIERAGVFSLELEIPSGYRVRQVRGREAAGARPVYVDTHDLTGENRTHLVVNLTRKAIGRVALVVELHRRLGEPDLLSPTGNIVNVPLAIPSITTSTVERATGRLVVYAPESLRVNPQQVEGLRSISFKEAFAGLESERRQRFPGARTVLAFAFGQEQTLLSLAVERRKPQVTASQLLVARIEAGVVKYNTTIFYEILYSGVKSLRIDLPASLAQEIRNNTPGVREKVIDPPPEDLAQGYVAWSLEGEKEFLGRMSIKLAWEKKIDKLEVGKSVKLTVPHIKPLAVDRAWGQIVLTKAETIDVRETGEPQGLRPIDPQHDLMPGASVSGAARAFEFHNDWALDITATRYKLEEIKRTSIERALVRMVITRSDQISVQALYRMRSARQRLAVQLPDGVEFDNDPLRINGRAVAHRTFGVSLSAVARRIVR